MLKSKIAKAESKKQKAESGKQKHKVKSP